MSMQVHIAYFGFRDFDLNWNFKLLILTHKFGVSRVDGNKLVFNETRLVLKVPSFEDVFRIRVVGLTHGNLKLDALFFSR